MTLKHHLASHWHHYTMGGIVFWLLSRIDLVWEKTEWLRAAVGWVDKKKKHKKRRVRK